MRELCWYQHVEEREAWLEYPTVDYLEVVVGWMMIGDHLCGM